MAKSLGAEVHAESFDWDDPTITDASLERIRTRIAEIKPVLITAVHCETPCGSLNNKLGEIGRMARENGALFLVDAVSSFVGTPVLVDVRYFFWIISSIDIRLVYPFQLIIEL